MFFKKVYRFFRRNKNQFLTDVVVFSFPKSGRTWLRVILAKYFSLYYDAEFRLNLYTFKKYAGKKLPYIFFDHVISSEDGSLNKELLRKRARKKSILLVRDPRDVVVSYYFQITQREPDVKKLYFQDKDVTMSEFIRHDKLGIANIVSYMNVLYEVVQEVRGNDFLIISYRDLKNKPFVTLKKLFEYAGITNVDNTLLQEAYQFSTFNNMKKMEEEGEFSATILQPQDKDNPETYKVRKGKVGGYVEYFTKKDQEFAAREIKKLNPTFGF